MPEETPLPFIGRKVYGRAGTPVAKICGQVTNTSACRTTGCIGKRLHVYWPDGTRTYPCGKEGCKERPNGDLEIT